MLPMLRFHSGSGSDTATPATLSFSPAFSCENCGPIVMLGHASFSLSRTLKPCCASSISRCRREKLPRAARRMSSSTPGRSAKFRVTIRDGQRRLDWQAAQLIEFVERALRFLRRLARLSPQLDDRGLDGARFEQRRHARRSRAARASRRVPRRAWKPRVSPPPGVAP